MKGAWDYILALSEQVHRPVDEVCFRLARYLNSHVAKLQASKTPAFGFEIEIVHNIVAVTSRFADLEDGVAALRERLSAIFPLQNRDVLAVANQYIYSHLLQTDGILDAKSSEFVTKMLERGNVSGIYKHVRSLTTDKSAAPLHRTMDPAVFLEKLGALEESDVREVLANVPVRRLIQTRQWEEGVECAAHLSDRNTVGSVELV